MSVKEVVNESLTPPGYWGSDIANINLVKDFLTEEESEKLNNYIRANNVWDEGPVHEVWKSRVHHSGLFTDNNVRQMAHGVIDKPIHI